MPQLIESNPIPRIRELAQTEREDIQATDLVTLHTLGALELIVLTQKASEQVPPNIAMIAAAGSVAMTKLLDASPEEHLNGTADLYKSVVGTAFPGVDIDQLPRH